MRTLLLFALLFSLISLSQAQTPAFPGAEGGGMYTTGGRGGTVYFVTSLDDTNTGNTATREGTLRWCLGQPGTKTIVFRVGGIIRLNSRLNVGDNTTIAGQTAPGDGICIADNSVLVNGSNVIIRFMRFRMGDLKDVEDDAIWGRNRSNIILDHCSMSWSTDECSSFYDNENFTMQWCILAESLRNSVHGKGAHGYGGIWGGKKATFHHNLLAHHDSRNPRFNGSRYSNRPDLELVDFRNNVIYNWGGTSPSAGEGGSYNFVNNYLKPGTSSSNKNRILHPWQNNGVWGTFYVSGNYLEGNTSVTNDNWQGVIPNSSSKNKFELRSETPFETAPVTTHTAAEAYEKVLAFAGASFNRDAVDARVVNEVRNGLAPNRASNGTTFRGLIDSQSDVGGWPDYNSGTAPVDSNRDGIPDGWLEENYPGKSANDLNPEGYTYLEVYLNSLVHDIMVAKGWTPGDNGETPETDIFCGSVPTDLEVPQALQAIITAGNLSIEGNRNDACTESGFTWRTNDVTFTLPSKARFTANFTANGGRTVYVTINGNEADRTTYNLGSSSCIPVVLNLNSDQENTVRIQSHHTSTGDPLMFSMTALCIKSLISTSVVVPEEEIKNTFILRDNRILLDDVRRVSIYSVNGVLQSVSENVNTVEIANLASGVYIVVVEPLHGKKSVHKFLK